MAPTSNPAPVDTVSLFMGEALIEGDGSRGPFTLPDRLILAGTEILQVDGRTLQAGVDYQLDAVRGDLRLTTLLPRGHVLHIRYEKSPYDLEALYFHRRLPSPAEPDTTPGVILREIPTRLSPGSPTELAVAGNKTFSVEIGSNRDMTLKQALNLSISGSLARDVEVRAVLSDTDIPLQPEGTTQELEQLDNVLVEVRSTHLAATLGDYDVSISGSRFAALERQLEGARATAEYDHVRASIAGALSKGEYHSMEFRGEEGKQGPYRLLSAEGSKDIVVVAGSERVTIFGERMVRGENNDYTIDYQEGTIQFTSKRLIGEDAEIAVDYEYMTEEYKRGLYFAETEFRGLASGRVDLGISVFSERDQSSQPISRDLTREDREVLGASGDSEAWVSGRTEMEEGGGSYDWVELSPGESCFVWVGGDSGRYDVRFTELPDSSGHYIRRFDDAAGRYVYECRERGPYVPLVRVPSPQSHTLADARWNVQATEHLSIAGEAALSSLDLNTFSDLDDGDNTGGVYEVEAALEQKPLGVGGWGLGKATVTGTLRSREERFRPLGRAEVPYYGKQWNLYTTSQQREERVREAGLLYEPWEGGAVRLDYGRLDEGADQTSIRKEAGLSQQWGDGGGVSSLYQKVDSWDNRPGGDVYRKRRRFFSEAAGQWFRVSSRISFEHDSRDRGHPDSLRWGLRYDEVKVSSGLAEVPRWTASAAFIRRESDEVSGGRWRPRSISNTGEVVLRHQRSGSMSGGAKISHRKVVYDPVWQEDDVTTDLADLDLMHALFGGRLKNNFNYRISNATRTLKERHFVYVGEGADYDSAGNFVDGEGFYEPVTVPGAERPVTEVIASARIHWDPAGASPDEDGWTQKVSSETFVKVDEKTTATERARIYLLDPGALQQDDTTLEGRLTLRQDLFLLPNHPTISLRLRYEYKSIKDNRFEGSLRDILEGQRTALLRSSPREGLGLELEYLNRWREEQVREGSGTQREDRRSHGVRVSVSQWFTQAARFDLRSQLETTTERELARTVRTLEVVPRITYSFLARGRAECAVTWRGSSGEEQVGTFSRVGWMGRPGWEWRISADYRIGRYVTASLTYSGTALEDRDTIHSGRSEVRAYF